MSTKSAEAKEPPPGQPDLCGLHDLADAQLLARFFSSRDEAAFAALVARHGPLVLGVCQRILGNSSDADDAFQATFLVLVRKGATLRQPESLASWLYGVAYRTARKLKSKTALRSKRESEAIDVPATSNVPDLTYLELTAILDEEISQLPQKYALPLLLCYLEGKTNAQAAAQLGWPEGSMSRRLSRARDLLRSRLAKRGLALSAALIAAVFSRPAVASVPPQLVASTVEAGTAAIDEILASQANKPDTDEETEETPSAAQDSKRRVSLALALAALLLAVFLLGWQLDAPAFASDLFFGGNSRTVLGRWWYGDMGTSGNGSVNSATKNGPGEHGGCVSGLSTSDSSHGMRTD